MTTLSRRVRGPQLQGVDESISYTLTTTPWGSAPTTIVITAKDETDAGADVTNTVIPGVALINGDVITLPPLHSLTAAHVYRIEVRFTTADGNTWEAYALITAEE